MRNITIAVGASRKSKKWINEVTTFKQLCERLSTTTVTNELVSEYEKFTKDQKGEIKDRGGFVGGSINGNERLKEAVEFRSLITLDVDNPTREFLSNYKENSVYTSFIYSTHSHTPAKPRLRVIIPLTRDVTPDEYIAISRLYANEWGIYQFDKCSFFVNQLMYWPTTPKDGEYLHELLEKKWMNPAEFLSNYPTWRDISTLPLSDDEKTITKINGAKQQDPLIKEGIIGAFCRTYTIHDAISTYLNEIYEPTNQENRYTFIKGESTAGVVIYEDKFLYSHHATDPACGHLLNAFDLVRIHKFGNDSNSIKLMMNLALNDDNVKVQILNEKKDELKEDFDIEEEQDADIDFNKKLTFGKNGKVENSLSNLLLILKNDPKLTGIVFNQLADGMEITKEVPWKNHSKFWRDADDSQLICYINDYYGQFSKNNYDVAVTKVVDDRSYHPIKEYFDTLPEWDGIPRVESYFIDYLGADDNKYVRMVTRKTLCAAYMRILHPGIKFDSMLVLNGEQGIGKSTAINNLGMIWYTDSLSISDMNDKTAAEKLQGHWILEIGELAGMKKADIDKVKAFISRQDDKYRASFGRRVTSHPRQSVFFGTTNSETGFLRDVTGNRRFWIIKTPGRDDRKPWDVTQEIVNQIWAEVIVLCSKGEKLYIDDDGVKQYAIKEQNEAMEHDEREGIVRAYLDTLLPEEWDKMDESDRADYLSDKEHLMHKEGTVRRTTVTNIEIWCECFGKRKEDIKQQDAFIIKTIMIHFDDWCRVDGRVRIPIYGQQRLYKRVEKK